jgi:hypothetical protein
MSDFDKLYQQIGSLAKAVDDNEKLTTPLLAVKLSRYAEAYPQDQTLGAMSRVIGKMASNNTLFIRKGDLKALYHKLYSRGTKFAELFSDELGEQAPKAKPASRQHDESFDVKPYAGDQVLANALESVFDKHAPLKMYSQPTAEKAIKSVGATLDVWNLRPSKLTVSDGNDKFIVVKADYETPKGITGFFVPVQVAKAGVLEPEVFMGNTGPQPLNYTAIKDYLTQNAGAKPKVFATDILNAITAAATETREVSAAELAVARLNASRSPNSAFFQNQVVGQKIAEAAKKDVELPKSDEFFSFEEKFTSPQGLASWRFGPEKVGTARNHIIRELVSMGFVNHQAVVSGNDENTIFYGVSLNNGQAAFTVPVKIADGKVLKPTVMLCQGALATFDKEGVNQLVSGSRTDTKVAAVASSMASLKPSEVLGNLRQALADENYVKAEDALNVLANSGDTKAYAIAFQAYMDGLSGHKVAETNCSRQIKNGTSEYPICSHTGLPINKVYQDKEGHCRPLYRKGMDETYEGASFMNAKVFG